MTSPNNNPTASAGRLPAFVSPAVQRRPGAPPAADDASRPPAADVPVNPIDGAAQPPANAPPPAVANPVDPAPQANEDAPAVNNGAPAGDAADVPGDDLGDDNFDSINTCPMCRDPAGGAVTLGQESHQAMCYYCVVAWAGTPSNYLSSNTFRHTTSSENFPRDNYAPWTRLVSEPRRLMCDEERVRQGLPIIPPPMNISSHDVPQPPPYRGDGYAAAGSR